MKPAALGGEQRNAAYARRASEPAGNGTSLRDTCRVGAVGVRPSFRSAVQSQRRLKEVADSPAFVRSCGGRESVGRSNPTGPDAITRRLSSSARIGARVLRYASPLTRRGV
jgi:hypothetical protein